MRRPHVPRKLVFCEGFTRMEDPHRPTRWNGNDHLGRGHEDERCCLFALRRGGAKVALIDRDAEAAEDRTGTIRSLGGTAAACQVDVSIAVEVEAAVREAKAATASPPSSSTTPEPS